MLGGVLAVVFCVTVATGTAVIVYRSGVQGPKTPEAATGLLLRSMAQNSINEFEQALCEPKRYQASAILREFNSGMVDAGQELDDIEWRITEQTRRSADEVELDVDVTFVVAEKRTGQTVDRPFPMRMQALEDQGWYICNIEILTL